MKLRKIFSSSAFMIILANMPAFADDHGHDHQDKSVHKEDEHTKENKSAHKEHEHKEEDKNVHKEDEHEEEGESAKNIGPEKGVISFDEETGFVLSTEAQKTFKIQTMSLVGSGPWTIPNSAILFTGEEKSIFRVRKNTYKSVDIEILKKNKNESVIQFKEFESGDQIVTSGVGYIRIAEIDTTSGESGHHH